MDHFFPGFSHISAYGMEKLVELEGDSNSHGGEARTSLHNHWGFLRRE